MSKKKLFLLDAYALIYRSYYAFIKNPRVNSKGQNTSAIFGFVNTLEEVLTKANPTHIAVAFDPEGPTFRHIEYEKYKDHRESTPEDIKLSVPIIKEIIRAYNIPVLEVPGYEADDVIGTIAKRVDKNEFDVYMMTPDKDYAQLTEDHIFMYKPKYGSNDFEVLDEKAVLKKYNITSPKQVIDLLGLMGDSSDNIPGCPGVGPKTAEQLLAQFGTIENLLENTDQLKGALKTKIEENKDYVTLLTCTPYGINTHRLLVRGTRIENTKKTTYITTEGFKINNLIVVPILTIPIIILLLIITIIKPVKKVNINKYEEFLYPHGR